MIQNLSKFQSYTKPSGSCQACLSETQLPKDCLITCQICRGCIHQTHYGSELLSSSVGRWVCERCRYFVENGVEDVRCQFCPSLRGIMKQYLFENAKIWLHPECAVWGYPFIFFTTNKKQALRQQIPKNESTSFWLPLYSKNLRPCQVCNQVTGMKINCKYHNCQKSYHVTCARPQGIVRDLESMKIQDRGGYFPVYCKQHLLLRIEDCEKRVRICKEKGEFEKAGHYQKLGGLVTNQLKNMQLSGIKFKGEEDMIKRMSLENQKHFEGQSFNWSSIEESFSSQQPAELLMILEKEMIEEGMPLNYLQFVVSAQRTKSLEMRNETNKQCELAPSGSLKLENLVNEDFISKDEKRTQSQCSQTFPFESKQGFQTESMNDE